MVNMLRTSRYKFTNFYENQIHFRFFCSVSKKIRESVAASHAAKPEDIPKGIYSEENDPKFTSVKEVKNHWHYVERLFPKLRIPDPIVKVSSVGWKAPAENIPDLPYYIQRTRNHMLPVYLRRINRDLVLVTLVHKVHGDIYVFEYELKKYLEEKLNEKIESNVNEISLKVHFRGDHVETVTEWLYSKGF